MLKKILLSIVVILTCIIVMCKLDSYVQDSFFTLIDIAIDAVDNSVNIVEEAIDSEEETEEIPEKVWEIPYVEKNGYYYNLLNTEEQKLYAEIAVAYLNYESEVDLSGEFETLEIDTVYKIHQYVLLDYPEIFWVDEQSSVTYFENDGINTLSASNATFRYTESEISFYQEALDDVVNEIQVFLEDKESDYEIALAVYEYIIQNCTYDMDAASVVLSEGQYGSDMVDSISVVGCLVNNEAVCSGYAKSYVYLLSIFGVEAISVTGTADDVAHEWNIIKLDGEYYQVDCTWGDPVSDEREEEDVSYGYFAVTTEMISKSHQGKDSVVYPECTATIYNYYVYNGLCFDAYSYETIKGVIATAIDNKQEEITFTFSREEEYQEAITQLLDGELESILVNYIEKLESQYSYSYMDDLYLITVKLVYKTE